MNICKDNIGELPLSKKVYIFRSSFYKFRQTRAMYKEMGDIIKVALSNPTYFLRYDKTSYGREYQTITRDKFCDEFDDEKWGYVCGIVFDSMTYLTSPDFIEKYSDDIVDKSWIESKKIDSIY